MQNEPAVSGKEAVKESSVPPGTWQTVVHNDPVNLMSYVQWVFESYFSMDPSTAHKQMLRVHRRGRAVVSQGAKEAMERDAQAMHTYGLKATIEETS